MPEGSADAAETATTETTVTQTETVDVAALQAEIDKWKTQSRKNEDRAKTNATAAKELDELRQSAMNDTDKAVAQAKAEGRTEALRDVGGKLVAAEVRAAAAGRGVDVDALLEAVDPSKFIGEDGEPDRALITAWVDRVAPASTDEETEQRDAFVPLDLGQGTRTPAAALNGDGLEQALKRAVGAR